MWNVLRLCPDLRRSSVCGIFSFVFRLSFLHMSAFDFIFESENSLKRRGVCVYISVCVCVCFFVETLSFSAQCGSNWCQTNSSWCLCELNVTLIGPLPCWVGYRFPLLTMTWWSLKAELHSCCTGSSVVIRNLATVLALLAILIRRRHGNGLVWAFWYVCLCHVMVSCFFQRDVSCGVNWLPRQGENLVTCKLMRSWRLMPEALCRSEKKKKNCGIEPWLGDWFPIHLHPPQFSTPFSSLGAWESERLSLG